MAARRPPVLLGRANERETLDQLLQDVRGGQSAVLVIRGEAGVGKTSLLRYCARQAAGFRVARIVGVESEMELPFAGLHQLCAPMLDQLGALPEPQGAALEVALGLTSGDTPDRFLVSLAALSLMAEAAMERPLLCFIDDAQWLDAASLQVLGFVARRVLAESVALVFGVRDPIDTRALVGLPELTLEGLPEEESRALLATVIPGGLDGRVRDRLVAETRGNPLAILELPRVLAATQLPGSSELPPTAGLSGQIEAGFLRQLDLLPEQARLLLLVAAAEPIDDPLLVWRAAERLGMPPSSVVADETAGLLAIGEHVTFLHPLVRSAVYRSASLDERRAVHLALGEVTDPRADGDRRIWHLAAAAPAPDEEVATELMRSADRARARGGLAATAAFLRRSVALTRDPEQRAERALAATQASLHAGMFDAALGLLATAEASELDAFQRARVDLLRGQIAFASGLSSDAPPLLVKAAKQLEPLDLALARDTYLNAWGAAMFAGPAGAGNLLEVCRAVRRLPQPSDAPRAVDVLLDGLALLVTQGRAAAAPTLLRAAGAFAGNDVPVEECLQWGWMATAASNALWDDDGLRAVCARQIELARDAGALEQLPIYLTALGTATARSGDFAAARSLMDEIEQVTGVTGTRISPYPALVLASLQGREAEASPLIEATIEKAAISRQGIADTVAHWVAAMLYNGLGRYEKALHAAQQASSVTLDLYAAMWALPELVEAAAHLGDADIARDALERLRETTQPAATAFGLGIEARSQALLSEDGAAESCYREAIDLLDRTRMRSELARAHLLYGEWLRREGRRVDAREQLRTAHHMFVSIGMEAFAERARRELLATGETVRKRTVETPDTLTAQEAQIARLARDGLTNPEIAARLYLSPRTVEWHLRKVFAKLEINSRIQLHDALAPHQESRPA